MVSSKKAMLHIDHEGSHVGDISYDLQSQRFGLIYSPEWLQKGFALSPHLPLLGEVDSENLSKFFSKKYLFFNILDFSYKQLLSSNNIKVGERSMYITSYVNAFKVPINHF